MRRTGNRTCGAGLGAVSNLTALEEEMVAAAAAGKPVDRGAGPFSFAEMDKWGPDRTVRAAVLRRLLLGTDPVAVKGVWLRGIRIEGHLDLGAATMRCPLRLASCYLDGPRPDFSFATVSLLKMTRCQLAGLAAESITVSHDLDLSGSRFTSPIELGGADITGWLVCTGAKLNGQDNGGRALIAFGMKVGGDVCLDGAFTATGAIQLIGADITGQLNCTGARLTGMDTRGRSLAADRVKVGRGVHLCDGFTAAGAIRLAGANIKSQLTCRGAHLNGRDEDGYALSAFTAKVGGDLILEKVCTTVGGIAIFGADIAGQLRCQGARLNGTNRDDNALVAFRMKVGTDVWFDGVTTKNGAIRLLGAKITGQLSCNGAQFHGRDKDGNALSADSVTVGGRVLLEEGFIADGTVRLPGANITGRLRCHRAELNGKDRHGHALLADGMTVGGGSDFTDVYITHGAISMAGANIAGDLQWQRVHLDGIDGNGNALIAGSVIVGGGLIINKISTTAGAIRIPGARITGRFKCSDTTLEGRDDEGRALLADGITIASGAWLGGVRTACGSIRMIGAEITGDLRCQGLRLKGVDESSQALVADRIKVSGSIFLGYSKPVYQERGSIAEGALSLKSAYIGGSLELKPEKLAEGKDATGKPKIALDLTGAQIVHELEWAPACAVLGKVVLEDTKVALLKDNFEREPNGHWPLVCDGLLRLDGFTYNRISEETEASLRKRLEWIGSPGKRTKESNQRVFTTQPYEQLAAVYRRAGQDREAREVAIARRRDVRRYGDLTKHRKAANWLLDKSIRYGYQTWRAVALLAVWYVLALAIFCVAQHHPDALIPLTPPARLHPLPDAMHCTSSYPCFYPAAYAIDTVIPIINVHQATYWGPNGHAPWGHALAAFTWISIALGWALTTLAVAGYTGLVRRD